MRRPILSATATALLLAALPGCAFMSNLFSGGRGGPSQVGEMVSAMEQVYVDLEVSKERVRTAVQVLRTMTGPEFKGDAVTAHAELLVAIERSEKHAEKLHDSVADMKKDADSVFRRWAKDLEAFTSPEMRQRSEARLAATRERYEAVVVAVDPAVAGYDAVNHNLRDHALFLSNDLNPAALAAIQADVRTVASVAAELERAVDNGLMATRAYVDAAALPSTRPDPEEPRPVPVGGEQPVLESSAPR